MKKKSLVLTTLMLAVPSIVQQLMTNLAQMADMLMVGQLQETAIAGVTITNQVFFIFMIVLFGIGGTAGIYLTQYHGAGNHEKMNEVFRLSLVFSMGAGALFYVLMHVFPTFILGFFAHDPAVIADAMAYLRYLRYTFLMLPIALMITNGFRFSGYVRLPMYLSMGTVLVGVILNFGLIHGNLGFPALGVAGAGLATLITRALEAFVAILLTFVLDTPIKMKVLQLFKLSKALLLDFIQKGYGLVLNEFFWAFGIQALTVIYTQRISANIASLSIAQTLGNMIFVGMGGMSVAFSILIGEHLGKDEFVEAKVTAKRMLKISALIGLAFGAIVFMLSFPIFGLYDVAPETIETARLLLLINALFSWQYYMNAGLYFTLRSGGDTKSVVLVDSGFNWAIMMPIAFMLGRFGLLLPLHFLLIQFLEFLKFYVGLRQVRKGIWLRNLT